MLTYRLPYKLRTLFIAIVLLAVPFAWVKYSLDWIRNRREAVAIYDDGRTTVSLPADFDFSVFQCRAPAGLWLFGETGFRELSAETPEDRERLKQLFPEAVITAPRDPHSP